MKRILPLILALWVWCFASPAWAIDPDGTTIDCPTGSLVTAAGTWTCPGPADPGNGSYVVRLNGSATGGAYRLRVSGGGQLYAAGLRNGWGGQWYKWNGSSFVEQTPQQIEVFDVHRTVRNAPGWLPSHAYTTGQRVNNGPGWNPTTQKFVWDQTLRAYQVAGNCTSAASGGPTGTGGAISDGTCTWAYSSDTDYVTVTGFATDAPRWVADFYGFKEVVTAPDANGILTAYQQTNNTGCVALGNARDNPPAFQARACGYNVTGGCNSTVAPPVGNASCTWTALQPVVYSSGRTSTCTAFLTQCIGIPFQVFTGTNWAQEQKLVGYHGVLWNDREYILGGPYGEGADGSLITQQHMSYGNHDTNLHYQFADGTNGDVEPPTWTGIFIEAAPGESVGDFLAANPTHALTGYDQSLGVGIRGSFGADDSPVTFRGLQMFNPTYEAFSTHGRELNASSLENSIVEVGTPGGPCVASTPWGVGAQLNVSNSLVINHCPNAVGFNTAYVGSIVNSTFVAPENNGFVGIVNRHNWIWQQGQYIGNSVFVGFQHLDASELAFQGDQPTTFTSARNFTTSANENVPPGTMPTFDMPWSDGTTIPAYEPPVPGMTYGVSSVGLFQATGDYRIPNSSILHGAGASFGDTSYATATTIDRCYTGPGQSTGQTYPYNCQYDLNSPSINGATRPSTGSDVGAWQQTGAAPTTFTLTVSAPSNGLISGPGISCGVTCSNTYSSGTNVSLTAAANPGFHFTSWGGACNGSVSPCALTMNSNQSVTANFAANSNPVSNRIARLVVRAPSAGTSGTPPLLQMPAGIVGSQTVEVGAGPNTITLQFSKANTTSADNSFVLYLSTDGINYVQITDTVNPMTVTGGYAPPSFNYNPQIFIFHGNWGNSSSVQFMKVVQTAPASLNALYTDLMYYDTVNFTYLGPSTNGTSPSQGYTNQNGVGLSPLIWSRCTDSGAAAPPSGGGGAWIDCDPVYNGTLSTVSGATWNGVTQPDALLSQLIDPSPGGIVVGLPAGQFTGTGRIFNFSGSGNTISGQGQGQTVITGQHILPFQGKALFDIETGQVTVKNLTLTGAQIGGNADNRNNSSNAGCIFSSATVIVDNVELTLCQDGIRGGDVLGLGEVHTISNSYFHDNGSRTGFTHELYLAGGLLGKVNNTKIVSGDRSGYALKNRFPTIINGGYYSSCTDPTAQNCAGLLDFPNGRTNDIQGMNTLTVGGTIHTGDVLTATFQHLSDTPIVVTSTVAAGPPTAQAATNALLTALQGSASLASAGWAFHASMPAGGGSLTPNAIDLYAPTRLVDWTITPSVTGGGATTTLTKTATPVTLVLNANATVPNGSTQIIKCQEEFNDGPCVMNLNNIIIDNRNSNAPRIAVGQWDTSPAMPGTVLNITNCHYTGGIAPQITGNWATVNGSCVTP